MGIILGGQPTKRTAISYPFMLGFSSMYLFEEIRTKIKNKDAILILMVLVALVPFKQSVLSSRLYYTEYITNKESEIVATKISNRIEEITGSYNPEEKIEQIIDEFGLHEKENTLCKKLSGGQCRRLSIALAIITDPKILFLDEPTLGLDVKARKILWDIVEKLKHKMTIILTTHYLEEVQFLADSAAIISKGRIKAVGTIPEILASTNSNTLEEAFIKLSEEE